MRGFIEKLEIAQAATGSRLCIGLDPDPLHMPQALARLPAADAISAFCAEVVGATVDVACAYKPNLAFFEALGPAGMTALEALFDVIPRDRVVIADGKRGDIGSTARRYAAAYFDGMPFDAVTVSPYMGADAITPFLGHQGRAAFVLVLTSNPGADQFQMLQAGDARLYEAVAEAASEAASGQPGTLGFVVGATRPERLADLRGAYPETPFLVPGVGTQGGDAATVVEAGGRGPLIVNVGRAILYASGGTDFARRAREEALRYAKALA